MPASLFDYSNFQEDISKHEMKIIKDDGVYRHIQVSEPGTSFYWFEVITSPRLLTINGDMGTYSFSRIEDMFQFFNKTPGKINEPYWTQKLVSFSSPVRKYSPEVFKQVVTEEFNEAFDERADVCAVPSEEESLRTEGLSRLDSEVLVFADTPETAARYLDKFSYKGVHFYDTWEWDFEEYDYKYLWNLHAIVWTVNAYNEAIA